MLHQIQEGWVTVIRQHAYLVTNRSTSLPFSSPSPFRSPRHPLPLTSSHPPSPGSCCSWCLRNRKVIIPDFDLTPNAECVPVADVIGNLPSVTLRLTYGIVNVSGFPPLFFPQAVTWLIVLHDPYLYCSGDFCRTKIQFSCIWI